MPFLAFFALKGTLFNLHRCFIETRDYKRHVKSTQILFIKKILSILQRKSFGTSYSMCGARSSASWGNFAILLLKKYDRNHFSNHVIETIE